MFQGAGSDRVSLGYRETAVVLKSSVVAADVAAGVRVLSHHFTHPRSEALIDPLPSRSANGE